MQTTAIDCVATMATEECEQELRLFLAALVSQHTAAGLPIPRVLVGTTRAVLERTHRWLRTELPRSLQTSSGGSLGDLEERVRCVPLLEPYVRDGIDRKRMEREPGFLFPSRHCDFMMEKASLMELALATGSRNVLFLDCDVLLLQPLPEVPAQAAFGVSRHGIAVQDERLFGAFNGGWVFAADPLCLYEWRRWTHTSRYFDQASLENVVRSVAAVRGTAAVHTFPNCCNFGYWRMFQAGNATGGVTSVEDVVRRFALLQPRATPAPSTRAVGGGRSGGRSDAAVAPFLIHIEGVPLQSVHTHFAMPNVTANKSMPLFNRLIARWMKECVQRTAVLGNVRHPYIPVLAMLKASA